MSKGPTPDQASVVVGLNSNLVVNNQTVHVQTEDLGHRHLAIVTHVFSEAGQVVKVVRFDYTRHRDKPNLRNILPRALQAQHAAVVRDLRRDAGELTTVPDSPNSQAVSHPLQTVLPTSGGISRCFRALLDVVRAMVRRLGRRPVPTSQTRESAGP
jgi:hypothetical protein